MSRPVDGSSAPSATGTDGTSPPRTPAPTSVSPSFWQFPPPALADADGIVGTGADLKPGTLVDAYRQGIFPWPHGWTTLPWFSPNPRGILRPESLRPSRTLRRAMRRSGWETTCDEAFEVVVAGCARSRPDGTWITDEMSSAYTRLHELGWAHSIEVWDGSRLVGGLYGVQVGAVFTGESMFHHESEASKVALCDLVDRFREAGGRVVDVQILTEHLASMGARAVARPLWLRELSELIDHDVRMRVDRLPAARLAVLPVAPA